jgi:autotransporter-associated beta strand protein
LKSRNSRLFRPTALAAALATLLNAPTALALNSVPVAVSEAYFGAASPDKLAVALAGLQPLIAELPLLLLPEPCWFCVPSYGGFTDTFGPVYGGGLIYKTYGPSPSLISAGGDTDLGASGAPVTLAFSRLHLTGSFETGRDFIIGSSAYGPTYSPSNWAFFEQAPVSQISITGTSVTNIHLIPQQPIAWNFDEDAQLYLPEVNENGITPHDIDPSNLFIQAAAPAAAGGPGWINTDGHNLKISGVVTSHQKLYKEGEGTLWLTGANVWHAAPEVKAGVLKGDAASLDTDIANAGLISFAQLADGAYGHVVSGDGGLEKTGGATLTLNQAQSYKGRTDILAGTLALGYRGQLPNQTLLTVESGAALDISGAEYGASVSGLDGNGSVVLGDRRLSISPLLDQTHSFAGVISGAGNVSIIGSGVQQFTGGNTYVGDTLIMGGNLAVAGDASLGAASGAVVLSGSGKLILLADINSARVISMEGYGGKLDSNGHDITLTSALEGNGLVLTKQGTGTLTLTSAATFSGNVTIAKGTLALLDAGALNSASQVYIEDGVLDLSKADGDRQLHAISGYDSAKIHLGGNSLILSGSWGTFNGVISGEGGLTLDGANVIQTLAGANTYTGTTRILAGTLRARTQSLSDRVINNGRLELFDYGDQNNISAYSGNISGTGMLVKTDDAAIWLRGHNSYTGGTVVEKGVLIGNTDSLPGNIETRAGLAFYQVANGTYGGQVSGSGTLMSYGPGALTLTGNNAHTGGTAFSNTLRIANDANLGGAQSGLLIAGGTLVALDNLSLNRHVALGEAGARFDSNGFNITLNGRIDGPGGVTKLGDGVLYLAGEHGYTGPTRVEQGGMRVNGSFLGDVQVLDGAWFEAKGHIGGDLSVAQGALFSAGNSPGALVVDGDFTATGELLVEITSRDVHDFLQVGGMANLAGARIHFVLIDGALPGDLAGISFLSAAGGIVGLSSASYQFDSNMSGYRVAQVGNTLQLAAVPEPETWAMLLAGLGLLARQVRRNRTWAKSA